MALPGRKIEYFQAQQHVTAAIYSSRSMRIFFPMLVVMALCACRPVHDTKMFYDDYVNPKRTVDYDNSISTSIPDSFLQQYYAVDNSIVRFLDQLDLVNDDPDSSWIVAQKDHNPWLKRVAVFDSECVYLSGDDVLGYDPAIRDVLRDKKSRGKRFSLLHANRAFLVQSQTEVKGHERFAIAEIDLAAVMKSATVPFVVSIEDGTIGTAFSVSIEQINKIRVSKNYSGSFSADKHRTCWIRSMAAVDFVYFYEE